MDNLRIYDQLAEHARLYYQQAANNNQGNAEEHFNNFVETARSADTIKPSNGKVVDIRTGKVIKQGEGVVKKYNPSVIKMAMQQGQCDILAGCKVALESGQIDESAFKQLQKNIIGATQRALRCNFGLGLVSDVKREFPKTFKKRIAISQCLRDGAFIMLENDAMGRTAATVNTFGEDLGLAHVNDLKPEKIKIYNIMKVGEFCDKIIFGCYKGVMGVKKLIKMILRKG